MPAPDRIAARRTLTTAWHRLSALALLALAAIGTISAARADALSRGTAAYYRGDYNRAARELEPVARAGNARALGLLGWLYEHGFGEPQDDPVATRLYAEGAERGDTFAQAMLGLMYDKGHGVQQDFVLAYKWLNLAAAHAPRGQRDVFLRLRDAVASKMSPNEIVEGQRRALYWSPVGFR